jgi:carbon storage regulator CsrA
MDASSFVGSRRIEMLVLSRKRDASVVIGSDIEVRVLSIRRGVVKLGIHAPPEVPIRRNELRVEDRSHLSDGHVTSRFALGETMCGPGR